MAAANPQQHDQDFELPPVSEGILGRVQVLVETLIELLHLLREHDVLVYLADDRFLATLRDGLLQVGHLVMVTHHTALFIFDMDWIASRLDKNPIELRRIGSALLAELGTHHHEDLPPLLVFRERVASQIHHVVLRPGHG